MCGYLKGRYGVLGWYLRGMDCGLVPKGYRVVGLILKGYRCAVDT